MNNIEFKKLHTLEERKDEFSRISHRFPNKIPLIIENKNTSKLFIPDIVKKKFLVPSDMTISQLLIVLRKRIQVESTTAIFLFVNDHIIPSGNSIISELYMSYKDIDGFLYLGYRGENTFGSPIKMILFKQTKLKI